MFHTAEAHWRLFAREAQGVRVLRTNENEKVVSVERVAEQTEDASDDLESGGENKTDDTNDGVNEA